MGVSKLLNFRPENVSYYLTKFCYKVSVDGETSTDVGLSSDVCTAEEVNLFIFNSGF